MSSDPREDATAAPAEGMHDPTVPAPLAQPAEIGSDHTIKQDVTRPIPTDVPQVRIRPSAPTRLGRYTIVKLLGSGGMGAVYRGFDSELDRGVAIKVLRHDRDVEAFTDDLRREAQALAKLAHPNVVTVYDVGFDHGQLYVVMQLIDGESIDVALRTRGTAKIVAAFRDAGRGLAAAHAANLVHCDFKPGNVLVDSDGVVRVSDFGLARIGLETATSLAGTPRYMAPEQFVGVATAASDQYSFCVALWEVLAGEPPFPDTPLDNGQAAAQARTRPELPRSAKVPGYVVRAMLRGLSPDPSDRFPAMEALLDALAPPAWRRWAIGGAAAVAVASIAFVALRPAHAACTGADTRLATAWNPALHAKIAQTFDAAHLPESRNVLERFVPTVDRWGAAWQQAYVGACEDTRVRAIQSDHMLDLRMACLNRRLGDAHAALDALSVATPAEAVDRAIGIARALPDVTPCADTTALSAAIAPPDTDSARQTVTAIGDELARARAQRQLAHYAPGLALARHALDDARKLGYRPTIAESLLVVGELQSQLVDRAAVDTLRDAMYEATSAGATELAIRAAAARIGAISSQKPLQPLADELGGIATALSERNSIAASAMVDLGRALGALLEAEGHVAEAKTKYQQTLALATKQLGPDHAQTIATLSNLAILAAQRREFDEARKMFEQIAAAEQRIYGPEHPSYATALDNLANIDADRGLSADSRALREKALAIRIAALGPDHPDVAASYDNLGGIYEDAGDRKTAKLYFEKAVAIYRKAYGPDSIDAANPLNNLGLIVYELGEHATGRKLVEEALAVAEKTYPKDDPRLVPMLRNLGSIARDDERYTEALALFQRAQQILEQANGATDATAAECLGYIATTYTLMGKLPEARAAHVRTIAAIEKVYGADSPWLGDALGEYGLLQLKLDDPAAAFATFEKARTLLEAKVGNDHPLLAKALVGRAQALVRLGREAEAVADLEHALTIGNAMHAEPGELAEIHFVLATALYAKPATRERARAEADLAVAGYEQADRKAALAKVHAWLLAH